MNKLIDIIYLFALVKIAYNCIEGELREVSNDCTMFEICNQGQWEGKHCPIGMDGFKLFWCQEAEQCLNLGECPTQMECEKVSSSTSKTTFTQPSPEITTTEFCIDSSFKGNPQNCSLYFMCSNGQWISMRCGYDLDGELLHWNQISDKCDYPEFANCAKQNQTTAKPTTESYKNALVCHNNNEFKGNPKDCTSFLVCRNAVWITLYCQRNLDGNRLHWNGQYNICDYPENSKCVENN